MNAKSNIESLKKACKVIAIEKRIFEQKSASIRIRRGYIKLCQLAKGTFYWSGTLKAFQNYYSTSIYALIQMQNYGWIDLSYDEENLSYQIITSSSRILVEDWVFRLLDEELLWHYLVILYLCSDCGYYLGDLRNFKQLFQIHFYPQYIRTLLKDLQDAGLISYNYEAKIWLIIASISQIQLQQAHKNVLINKLALYTQINNGLSKCIAKYQTDFDEIGDSIVAK